MKKRDYHHKKAIQTNKELHLRSNKRLRNARGVFFAWACATAEQAIFMEAHRRVCLHQNGASQTYHRDYFASWSWQICSWLNKMCTLGSRGNLFLIDTDGSWRRRVNEERLQETWWKSAIIITKKPFKQTKSFTWEVTKGCVTQEGSFLHEHARPLNKRFSWRLTAGSAFIKTARLKPIIEIILLVGHGKYARD